MIMANERITEDIVRSHFKDDALFTSIKWEEQRSSSKRIQDLLKGESKGKGKGNGYPEFILSFPTNSSYIIVIECKAKVSDHCSASLNEPIKYAVDGVLHYAKALSADFNVIAIAVSGQNDTELKVNHFYWKKKADKFSPISDTKLLAIDDYMQVFDDQFFISDFYTRDIAFKAQYLNESFNKIRNVLKLAYMFFLKEKNEDNKLRNEYIDPKLFKEFREKNIKYINKYADRILCVSKRVKEIALEMGIEETKLDVCYIGTAFAKNARNNINSKVFGLKHFKIAYMGYMRKDKGLYFFVDALEQLDINISQNMEVIIAAKFEDNDLVNRIEHLKKRFANLKLLDGYTHKDIPQITENLSLGIVPVMWEDCLPQVAIEFKAMGIPVLSSDLGGASELTEAKEFCFRAGNIEDFLDHLIAVYENRDLLNTYYRKHLKLMTVEEHCKELMKYYK